MIDILPEDRENTKARSETLKEKFDNLSNYPGKPLLPGSNWLDVQRLTPNKG